jgi:hypothetical protein
MWAVQPDVQGYVQTMVGAWIEHGQTILRSGRKRAGVTGRASTRRLLLPQSAGGLVCHTVEKPDG